MAGDDAWLAFDVAKFMPEVLGPNVAPGNRSVV
jgi:hypothetical protein